MSLSTLSQRLNSNKSQIEDWFEAILPPAKAPLYVSCDVRDSGYKLSIVDTNLFPAGFNNLCAYSLKKGVNAFQTLLAAQIPQAKNILLVTEEHTRNPHYLDNVRILKEMLTQAGYAVRLATFLSESPEICDEVGYIDLPTSEGFTVRICCLKSVLKCLASGQLSVDAVLLNNDLSTGIPDTFKKLNIPFLPLPELGWHARRKSHHFLKLSAAVSEFFDTFVPDLDPWLFRAEFSHIDNVSIGNDADREKMADLASDLLRKISEKYREHHVEEKPFIFLKSDTGTYGMGVLAVEDASEITELNRKNRNKLYKGKGALEISHFILQEGVSSRLAVLNASSELVSYLVGGKEIGCFYRSNTEKSSRDNLNSKGMGFYRVCEKADETATPPIARGYEIGKNCGLSLPLEDRYLYAVLARLACLAASRELS